MKNKTYLLFIALLLLSSCGKHEQPERGRSDPETEASADAFSGEALETEGDGQAGILGMGAREASEEVSIKAGTFNIWAPAPRRNVMAGDPTVSDQRSWANSHLAVADMIHYLDCDVIGLQEVSNIVFHTTVTPPSNDYDGNLHTLNPLLPDYSWVIYNGGTTTYDKNFPDNTSNKALGTTDAILYKPSELTLVSHGRRWLTGTRATAPKDDPDWDKIGTQRTATWARFTHKASGRQFVFIVTHLDLPNAGNTDDPGMPQRRNASELIGWLAPMVAPENLPSVIVGDMNTDAGEAYDILRSGIWADVYETMLADGTLSYMDRINKGTMNANKNETGGLGTWRPDHILIHGFTPSLYKVGRETFATADGSLHWPSDHFPIKVILNF